MKKRVLFLLFLVSGGLLSAQQLNIGSSNYLENSLMNPALAGSSPISTITLSSRNQWQNLQGAPVTNRLLFNTPLQKERWGLFLGFQQDQTDAIEETQIQLSLSYKVRLSEQHSLSFGLNPTLGRRQIDFSNVRSPDPDDPLLFSGIQSDWNYNSNFGMVYQFGDYLRIGAVADQLLAGQYVYQQLEDELSFTLLRQFQFHAQYRFVLNDFFIDPLVRLVSVQGIAPIIEPQVFINYRDRVWLGGIYNTANNFSLAFGFVAFDVVKAQYSYGMTGSSVSSAYGGNHEFGLSIRLSSGKGEESIAGRKLRRLEKQSNEQFTRLDSIQGMNRELNRKLDSLNTQLKTIQELRTDYKSYAGELEQEKERVKGVDSEEYLAEFANLKEQLDSQSTLISNLMERFEAMDRNELAPSNISVEPEVKTEKIEELEQPKDQPKDQPKNQPKNELNKSVNPQSSEKQEAVSEPVAEKPSDDLYVVVGSFLDLASAKRHVKSLAREGIPTKIVTSIDMRWYYVYSHRVKSVSEGHLRFLELRKKNISELTVGKVWYFRK